MFCDRGAFDVDEARTILQAGADAGLGLRMHASQLGPGAGIKLAVELGAASVDHCTYADDSDLEALAGASTTVATLLPGAEFSTRAPWPEGERLRRSGRDDRPGDRLQSRHVVHDQHAVLHRVAVRDMHLTPAEALRAATAGGAAALRRDDIGVLAPGMRADFVRLDAPSYIHLAYRPGVPIVDDVVEPARSNATKASPNSEE